MPALRILIVDDHVLVREGLTALLNREADLQVVAEASNGQEALAQFRQHRPDITLMDVRMPVMDGAEATEAIMADYPEAVILVVTTMYGEAGLVRALKAGAKTYLLKDTSRERFLHTIRTLSAVAG